MSVSAIKRAPGIELELRERSGELTGRNVSYIVHPMLQEISVEVMVPLEGDSVPEGHTETQLSLSTQKKTFGVYVQIQKIQEFCNRFGYLKIPHEKIQRVCRQNELPEFITSLAAFKSLGWRTIIEKCRRDYTKEILTFLFYECPKWREICQGKKWIFIPQNRRMPGFEYKEDGTIFMYYSFQHREEVQTFVVNLNENELFQTIEYMPEEGIKIKNFKFLTRENPGLLFFVDYIHVESERRSVFIGKHPVFDANLQEVEVHPDKTYQIAIDLILGLITLEKEGVVHLGIYPSNIRFRHVGEELEILEARITDFQKAFKVNNLPKKIPLHSKMGKYIPPETSESLANIKFPFAIPIYQLGMCFQELFKLLPKKEKDIMDIVIKGMTCEDPEKRWSTQDVLEVLERESKSQFEVPPEKAYQIASDLILGLIKLEKEGIVHLGICPSNIRFRHIGKELEILEARITDFQKAFKVNNLPKKIPLHSKMGKYIPPETRESLANIKFPFAIPIYQLGMCFRELFKLLPKKEKDIMDLIIKGMTCEDPEKRWSTQDVLEVLKRESKSQ